MVRIEQDIAGVALSGKGLQINIAALPVPDPQETYPAEPVAKRSTGVPRETPGHWHDG
jgi:hypothetical protein